MMGRARSRDAGGFTLVELLVVVLILGVVMGGITSVVMSTLRVEQNQRQLQDVIDDGRNSITNIRREVREARRILESSGPDRLHFWIDQNQDSIPQAEELICYVVEPLPDGTAGQWQISRWTHAEQVGTPDEDYDDGDCAPGALPSGQSRRVVASTLVDPEPFVELSPPPGGPNDPQTREVVLMLQLEVIAPRGPDSILVEGSIRLRNVP